MTHIFHVSFPYSLRSISRNVTNKAPTAKCIRTMKIAFKSMRFWLQTSWKMNASTTWMCKIYRDRRDDRWIQHKNAMNDKIFIHNKKCCVIFWGRKIKAKTVCSIFFSAFDDESHCFNSSWKFMVCRNSWRRRVRAFCLQHRQRSEIMFSFDSLDIHFVLWNHILAQYFPFYFDLISSESDADNVGRVNW